MTTLKERFELKFGHSWKEGAFAKCMFESAKPRDILSFFRAELLTLAEEVHNMENNGVEDAATLIRSKANEI